MPGVIFPDEDREWGADVVARSHRERADLRRRMPWLVVVFIAIAAISLSGLAGCYDRPVDDDSQGWIGTSASEHLGRRS